jgi:carbonic anhydrase/acetyltransferase-like protein (isoleucine patch superfamily)
MLIPFQGRQPRIHPSVYIAEGAKLIGDVEVGEEGSVWFNTVLRGDINFIRIGRRSNVQDNCVFHLTRKLPVIVGDEVTFGHSVTAHGCVIEDLCLIGIGAVILDDAVIGTGSIVAAGAVVPPGLKVPPRSLVMGVPGKVVKTLPPDSADSIRNYANNYVGYAKAFLAEQEAAGGAH